MIEEEGDPVGFLGNIFKGVTGAVGGFIKGGPLGAVSGAVSGITSKSRSGPSSPFVTPRGSYDLGGFHITDQDLIGIRLVEEKRAPVLLAEKPPPMIMRALEQISQSGIGGGPVAAPPMRRQAKKRRAKKRRAKAKKAKPRRRTKSRAPKFGGPAWRKKYGLDKKRRRRAA